MSKTTEKKKPGRPAKAKVVKTTKKTKEKVSKVWILNRERFIGRAMIGFKFETNYAENLYYYGSHDKNLGKVGNILCYNPENDTYTVDFFENGKNNYPSIPAVEHSLKISFADYMNSKIDEKAVEISAAKNEIIADLETRLDDSYKEQERMLKELDKCIYATIHHCSDVECNTGKITLHDVDYCVDMIKRILNHKFGYKPKMD